MKVEESLRTLGLLRTASPRSLWLFWLLYFRPVSDEIDGMFTSKSFNGRNFSPKDSSLPFIAFWNRDGSYFLTLPRVIQTNVNLESTMSAMCQVEEDFGAVTLLGALEWQNTF